MPEIIELETNKLFETLMSKEAWTPMVLAVAENDSDLESRVRTTGFIGSVVTNSEVVLSLTDQRPYSLHDAITEASNGKTEAISMVRRNVATDIVERTIKSGHITKVPLEIGKDGCFLQSGQSIADIQRNSLLHASENPKIRSRTEAEIRNMFRIDKTRAQGLLEDYAFVVFSRAPDDMSEEEASKVGFFSDTMSCAIQLTTVENGNPSVESAFVAGKRSWENARHDKATIGKVGDELGVDFHGKDATELLDYPVLIHKSLIPNGVIDIVNIYDRCAGGTFFGESKPKQDYLEYLQTCRQREADLQPQIQKITSQLISEAPTIKSPKEASRRLAKLSEGEMLERSIADKSINPRVFGEAAAWRIEQARYYLDNGQTNMLSDIIYQAKTVAVSSSCPGGVSGNETTGVFGESSASSKKSNSSNKLEDCEFVSKECPKCHKKDVKTVVKKGVYYGDCGCHS